MFILWAALHRVRPYTTFCIMTQLEEQAKSRTSVITVHGIDSAFAYGLGLGNLLFLMLILHDGALLNLETCAHMEIFIMVGNQVWVNHHGHAFFPLFDTPHTTVTNEANWSYDNDIDGEGCAEDTDHRPYPRDEGETLDTLELPMHDHGSSMLVLLLMRLAPLTP